jgi:RHS repeat-associated protein
MKSDPPHHVPEWIESLQVPGHILSGTSGRFISEIYRQTLAQNGQVIFKDIAYNVIGKVDTQSRFHFAGGNPQITTYDYDVLGRVIQQNAFNTGVTTFSYNIDNKDNVQATNAKGQKVKQTNNVKGLLAEVVDNLNKVTTYTYTPFGDLQQVKDSSNNTTSLTYDIRGRRTQIADPDMGTWNYVYNAFGDLVSQTDARGLAVQMTYDKLSRIRTKMNGSQTYVWSYDTAAGGIGMPSQVTGPNGFQETYTYDTLGRPVDSQTTVDGVAYTVTTGYDTYGRVSRIDYPASVGGSRFAVQYQYTSNGYLEKVVDAASGTAFWTAGSRNALGQVTEEPLGSGLKTTNSFDDATGRLLGIVTNNGASAQSLTYTYDTLGNLLSRRDNLKNLTESFTYDTLNRLTAVSGPQPKTFAYNSIGNITSKTGIGSYTYGGLKPHAVTAAGGVSYTYDANGNITGDSSGRSISFDGFNRPVGVAKTGASGSFVYDAADLLVKQVLTKGPVTTTTIYVGDIYEKITTGSLTEHNHYILAENVKVAMYTRRSDGSSSTYYLHRDHLGSTDVITNGAKAIVDQLSYDAHGMRRNATTWMDQAGVTCAVTDYGYTGHLHLDDFGLIHMKSRIYDPRLGRFLSPDSVVQNVADMQMLNRYSYCGNNPLKYVDPTGNVFEQLSDLQLGGIYYPNTFDFNAYVTYFYDQNSFPSPERVLYNEWAQAAADASWNSSNSSGTSSQTDGMSNDVIATTESGDFVVTGAPSPTIDDGTNGPIGNVATLFNHDIFQMYAANSNNQNDFQQNNCNDVSVDQANAFTDTLISYSGTRYVLGGITPGVELDCSGAIIIGMRQTFNVDVPRLNANGLVRSIWFRPLGLDEAPRRGDIVWWSGHVVCYDPSQPGRYDFIGAHGEGHAFGPGNVQSTTQWFNKHGYPGEAIFYRMRLPNN